MQLKYNVKASLVRRVIDVTHKGKKRNFNGEPDRHYPDVHELLYVDYGKVKMRIGNSRIVVKSGECIFLPGGVTHSFSGEDGAPFDFLNIMLWGKLPKAIFRKSLPANRDCLLLLEKLKQESIQEIPYCKQIIACYLTELIIHFMRQIHIVKPDKPPGPVYRQRYRSEIVNRALSVIAGNYASQLTPMLLGKAVGASESHLRYLLRRETGKNFRLILHEHRVAAAKHLLMDSKFTIQETADAVGYKSTSFFFKVFKTLAGMTPKAYSSSLGEPAEKQ